MPTYAEDGKISPLFLFNHIIGRFRVLHSIVTDHESDFRNQMMEELSAKLGFRHENSTPYYPQATGQVEAINKVLKTMLRQMVGDHKSNWHHILFSALWAYRTSVKTTLMRLKEMLPWLMRHIRNASRSSIINPSNLVSLTRVT